MGIVVVAARAVRVAGDPSTDREPRDGFGEDACRRRRAEDPYLPRAVTCGRCRSQVGDTEGERAREERPAFHAITSAPAVSG
jgi:hypothetical protein